MSVVGAQAKEAELVNAVLVVCVNRTYSAPSAYDAARFAWFQIRGDSSTG